MQCKKDGDRHSPCITPAAYVHSKCTVTQRIVRLVVLRL